MAANAKVVRDTYEAFNRKEMKRMDSLAQPDATVRVHAFGADMPLREYFANWARAFPDGVIDVQGIVEAGDCVVTEYIGRGTHTGLLQGPGELTVEPTGRSVEVPFCEVWQFRDGKLSHGRIYFDMAGFMDQLGIEPEEWHGARPAPAEPVPAAPG